MFWKRKNKKNEPSREVIEARTDRIESEKMLNEVRSMTPAISELRDRLVDLRERNHFGESIELAYGLRAREQ